MFKIVSGFVRRKSLPLLLGQVTSGVFHQCLPFDLAQYREKSSTL
jgi:hypothetical protein